LSANTGGDGSPPPLLGEIPVPPQELSNAAVMSANNLASMVLATYLAFP
jgi:hypothetical protein